VTIELFKISFYGGSSPDRNQRFESMSHLGPKFLVKNVFYKAFNALLDRQVDFL